MQNFTLKFGQYKGEQFLSTPESYQKWLIQQDWFKLPKLPEARYDVVKKFTSEYKIGMGISKEIVLFNLSWDEANIHKDAMNIYQLDDTIQHYYIESSINQ